MKSELENQKKYNLQMSSNLLKQPKRKSRIMSSSYKMINQNMNTALIPSFLLRITHFSHFFPRNKITKKAKSELDELWKI